MKNVSSEISFLKQQEGWMHRATWWWPSWVSLSCAQVLSFSFLSSFCPSFVLSLSLSFSTSLSFSLSRWLVFSLSHKKTLFPTVFFGPGKLNLTGLKNKFQQKKKFIRLKNSLFGGQWPQCSSSFSIACRVWYKSVNSQHLSQSFLSTSQLLSWGRLWSVGCRAQKNWSSTCMVMLLQNLAQTLADTTRGTQPVCKRKLKSSFFSVVFTLKMF